MDRGVWIRLRGRLPRASRGRRELRQLLAHDLAHGRTVRAPGDLRHHVRHHPAEVAQARRAVLRDRVVDDVLDLVLAQRLGHELLEDVELVLLVLGLLLAPGRMVGVGGLEALLSLALEHLQLLVLRQRPLQLLLGRLQTREDQPERVAAIRVAREHRVLHLLLEIGDETHAASPVIRPPSTCQCRWNTVWPAPWPTLTTTL